MSTTPMSPAAREIARIIKNRVDESDWTQTSLAPRVGVDQSQLSKMLRGVRPFTIDQLYAICVPLGLTLVDVIREAERVAAARSGVRHPEIHDSIYGRSSSTASPSEEEGDGGAEPQEMA